MHAVCGIPDQRQPFADQVRRVLEAQRIGGPARIEADRTEHAAHPLFDLRLEGAVRQLHHAVRIGLVDRPHQRAAMLTVGAVEQGQESEGSVGIEDFPGHVCVRLFMIEPDDDGAVAVIPFGEVEPFFLARRRAAPFGGHHQPATQGRAVRQRRAHAKGVAPPLHDFHRRVPGDRAFGARGIEQSNPERAVGEHPPKRVLVRLRLEVDTSRLHLIGYRNGIDRAAVRFERIGKADIAEKVPARSGDCRGPTIETFRSDLGRIGPVHDMAGEAALRCGERQRHADESSAEDQEVACFGHGYPLLSSPVGAVGPK